MKTSTLAQQVWVMQCNKGNILKELYNDVINCHYGKGYAFQLGVITDIVDFKKGIITYIFKDGSELTQISCEPTEEIETTEICN